MIQKPVFFPEVLSYSFPFNLHLERISDLQRSHKSSAEFQNSLRSASLIVNILCNHQHKDTKTDSLNLTYKSYLNLTSSSTSTSFSVSGSTQFPTFCLVVIALRSSLLSGSSSIFLCVL